MKPWTTLATAHTPDGTEISLVHHDGDYVIRAGRQTLMSSRAHGSEEAMATLACALLQTRPGVAAETEPIRILVGGLGLGYTLRAALDALPSNATVVVAELLPEVVVWNEGPLGPLARHPLRDPRVEVRVGDIRRLLHHARDAFDAILLDIDNGPSAFVSVHNASLYGSNGLATLRTALRPNGVLALWSLEDDRRFVRRLRSFDFDVRVERIAPRPGQRGAKHVVFMAVRQAPPKTRASGLEA